MTRPVPESPADGPWYRGGLRFACTQCGNCCSGPPGAVWFTPEEGRAIAEFLGLEEDAFLARYGRRVGGRRSLVERREGDRYDCVFLLREGERAGCAIYDVRPRQCRTWPFWRENLESESAWLEAKRRTPCPGMGSGPLHGLVTITASAAERAP